MPGSEWEAHSLPIGNGYMGATVLGGVVTDKLNIAEKTLWTGGPGSREGYDFGWPQDSQEYQQIYREVTNTILRERAMSPEDVAAKLGRDPTGYGSYQAMLDIDVTFSHDDQVEQYQRELDMATGLVTV
ncbi:MAG: glycoside hydrolase family 95 protein, partial [Aestuariibacter sp.]|nr:glycoside hydrolase family 95 protein [Aestuariibacter sp.]